MPSYIIYCRKSSESEERQVLSIESQIKELNELAKRLNLSVSEVLTESRSAKQPGRPVFNLMMKKILHGDVKGIISWKLDRIARNPVDGGEISWALDQGQIEEIITPTHHLRNNSNDKFLMQLEFGMAKKYVDDLSDNVKRGLRMKLEKGWLPGRAPLGYLNEPRERTIVPDPELYPLVLKMWELLLQGTSPIHIHKIATEEMGLRQRRHGKGLGKPISLSSIYKMFINPFYYGIIQRKGNVYQGKHQPIISEAEYWQAQELLGHKGKPRPKTHHFSFTGLIRCGECGGCITAEEKVNRYGSRYVYYHCTKKKRTIKCAQRVIQEKELERQMLEYLDRIHVPQRFLEMAFEYLEKEHLENREQEVVYRQSLEKAQRDCIRKLENLNQMRIRDLLGDEEYVTEKRKLIDEKLHLEENLKADHNHTSNVHSLIRKSFTFAHEARECFQKAEPEGKKTLLREMGSNFLLKDKKLSINVQKPFVLIHNALNSLKSENEWIEPAKYAMKPRVLPLSDSDFLVMCPREVSKIPR